LTPGGENRISIVQAPACGSLGQPCCSVGSACVSQSGCLGNICTRCPPPQKIETKEFLRMSNEFVGNNIGGQHIDRTYGGACDSGFQRTSQCVVQVTNSCGDGCSATPRWATSNAKDCTCIVHFDTPNDFSKGIHVNVIISETTIPISPPPGC
jgi:hypothetical protein